MKRLACLLFLGAALGATGLWPALAKVTGASETVAVVSPPLSAVRPSGGCTPVNPCAVATPALSDVTLPAPESPPQPQDASGAVAGATPAAAPAPAQATAPGANAAQANCPPLQGRGRGDFAGRGGAPGGQGRGDFAGRAGQGRGGFAGRFGQGRDGGGAGRGNGPGGRGQQFAQNFRGGRGREGCPPTQREGRGQGQGGDQPAPGTTR